MDISKTDAISRSLSELIDKSSSMIAKSPPEMKPAIEREMKRLMPIIGRMPVLALINEGHGAYGYEIMQFAEKLHIKGLGASRVYPMLHRMEKNGLLKSKWDGRKKIYHVTAKGKRYITWWKESLKMGIIVKVKMLKLIFGEEVKI